jgi:hypothetical protein
MTPLARANSDGSTGVQNSAPMKASAFLTDVRFPAP